MEKVLKFKWTVSRGRDTYGYNICSLWIDGKKVSSCNGGGYDMQGTALAGWMEQAFKNKLLSLEKPFYGLSFYDLNFKPEQQIIDGQTIKEREKEGKSIGLERYQAFHSARSDVPTPKHDSPLLDGACGFSSMETILNAIGHKIKCLDRSTNQQIYMVSDN